MGTMTNIEEELLDKARREQDIKQLFCSLHRIYGANKSISLINYILAKYRGGEPLPHKHPLNPILYYAYIPNALEHIISDYTWGKDIYQMTYVLEQGLEEMPRYLHSRVELIGWIAEWRLENHV